MNSKSNKDQFVYRDFNAHFQWSSMWNILPSSRRTRFAWTATPKLSTRNFRSITVPSFGSFTLGFSVLCVGCIDFQLISNKFMHILWIKSRLDFFVIIKLRRQARCWLFSDATSTYWRRSVRSCFVLLRDLTTGIISRSPFLLFFPLAETILEKTCFILLAILNVVF